MRLSPKQLLRAFLLAASASGALASAGAQSAALPTPEPVLTLPDMNEEAKGVDSGSLESPLPPLPPPPPPASAPASPELSGPASPLIPTGLPAPAGAPVPSKAAVPAAPATLAELSLGAGLWNALSADLSLSRRSADLSYGLDFSHQSLDGFSRRNSGAGSYQRRDSLSGDLSLRSASGSLWTAAAGFSDEADGLQLRAADFTGVDNRAFDASAGWTRPLGEAFGGGLSASLSARGLWASHDFELASADPAGPHGADELSVRPQASLSWSSGAWKLGAEASAALRGLLGLSSGDQPSDRSSWNARAGVNAAWSQDPALSLKASLSAASSSTYTILAPFSLGAESVLGGARFALSGGLRSDPAYLADLWKYCPYLDVGELPPDDARWYSSATALLPLPGSFSLSAGADWASSLDGSGRLLPTAISASRGLYAYEFDAYRTLATRGELRWTSGGLTLAGGLASDWLDAPVLGQSQRITGRADWREASDAFGGTCAVEAGYDDYLRVPQLNAGGFLRLSRSARLSVDLQDLLFALEGADGRMLWVPYQVPGLRADVRLRVSF